MSDSLPVEDLLDSWELSLRARNRTQTTIKSYKLAVVQFTRFLESMGLPSDVDEVTNRHVEAWLAELQSTHASATVRQRYASLKQWFRWLAKEGEIEADPMADMEPPKIDEKPVPVIPMDDLRALLAACNADTKTRPFEAARDTAIVRLFLDTGIRLEEMAGIGVDDVDRRLQVVTVLGKGRRFRTVAYDIKTAEAVDRYHRQRLRHKDTTNTGWWLGRNGRLSSSGVAQIIKRRCADAGIDPINPHRFRHTFAHQWLARGGNEGDLQQMAGWSSPQMLQRYGSSAAEQRAQEAHRRIGLWEDL